MARRRKRHKGLEVRRPHSRPGAPPGSVIIDPQSAKPAITVIAFGPDAFVERPITDLDELTALRARHPVCWVNVDGLGDAATLQRIAAMFHMHPLALEDTVNRHQRAKVEQYGEQTFLVTHMVESGERLDTEQLSVYFGQGFVLTFQERPGWDCLDPVRERLRKNGSRLRSATAGYLAYSILDAVIDNYFPVLEAYGERLEDLEDRILLQPHARLTAEIHDVKRDLLHLRRAIWPQREALNTLIRDPNPHIDDETRIYLRDCYDHTIRIIDLVETYREVGSDLMDLYLSSISNRMNEIMKVLTVISTLFIPLTFVAGVYGMNFDPGSSPWNMPELRWRWGYPACLAVMLAISAAQLLFFRRKGWIGRQPGRPNGPAEPANETPPDEHPASGN